LNKLKKMVLILLIVLCVCNSTIQADEMPDLQNTFQDLTIYEQQDELFKVANDYYERNLRLNTKELIKKVYNEASDGLINLEVSNDFNYYNSLGWLVKGILPETRYDTSYIYINCYNFREQIEKELLDINLIMANLKVGDILIFKSKESVDEEMMLYIGHNEDNNGDTLYCKGGKIKKIKLRYYLGQDIKNKNIEKRSDKAMPLVGVARPLTCGGYASYFEPEEKFYADFPLEKHERDYEVSSSELFTYSNANVEYEGDEGAIGDNNYQKIKDVLINSDNIIFQMIKLVENIGAMILLSVCIILGIRYMTCSKPEQKSKLKKSFILIFLSTMLIFFARRIAIIVVYALM